MISEKKNHKAQVSSPWCMHTPQTFQRGIQKNFSALKLLLCGLVVFIDMNTYFQKEAGVSEHSWKKIIQLLWTVVSYLLKKVKYEIEHNINSTYRDIRHLWKLQQIYQICCSLIRWWTWQPVSFCYLFMGRQISYKPW